MVAHMGAHRVLRLCSTTILLSTSVLVKERVAYLSLLHPIGDHVFRLLISFRSSVDKGVRVVPTSIGELFARVLTSLAVGETLYTTSRAHTPADFDD